MSDQCDQCDQCEQNHAALKEFVERRINACRGDIATELRRMNEMLGDFTQAFPPDSNGAPDFSGHRSYHDKLIAAAKAQETFWNELRLDLAKKGLWSILTVLVGLLLLGAMTKLGIKP